ncbi:MAG: type II 3-dehydroquinate dehydratase [Candidatus Zixiibacteriota bacterium]
MSKPILVLHGPNLNRLGLREPEIYGRLTLAEINDRISERGRQLGVDVEFAQSNHEGVLIDRLHAAADSAGGVILNPGALAHTSIALRDAVASIPIPVIEVHLSNIFAREEFRQRSVVSGACRGVISGLGVSGYLLALEYLAAETAGR